MPHREDSAEQAPPSTARRPNGQAKARRKRLMVRASWLIMLCSKGTNLLKARGPWRPTFPNRRRKQNENFVSRVCSKFERKLTASVVKQDPNTSDSSTFLAIIHLSSFSCQSVAWQKKWVCPEHLHCYPIKICGIFLLFLTFRVFRSESRIGVK